MAKKAYKERLAAAEKADGKYQKHVDKPTNLPIDKITEYLGGQMPKQTMNRLRLAAAQRKNEDAEPYTQQEITAAALAEWLTKYGY